MLHLTFYLLFLDLIKSSAANASRSAIPIALIFLIKFSNRLSQLPFVTDNIKTSLDISAIMNSLLRR